MTTIHWHLRPFLALMGLCATLTFVLCLAVLPEKATWLDYTLLTICMAFNGPLAVFAVGEWRLRRHEPVDGVGATQARQSPPARHERLRHRLALD